MNSPLFLIVVAVLGIPVFITVIPEIWADFKKFKEEREQTKNNSPVETDKAIEGRDKEDRV